MGDLRRLSETRKDIGGLRSNRETFFAIRLDVHAPSLSLSLFPLCLSLYLFRDEKLLKSRACETLAYTVVLFFSFFRGKRTGVYVIRRERVLRGARNLFISCQRTERLQ